jgi:hypothetical protein
MKEENVNDTLAAMDAVIKKLEGISKEMRVQARWLSDISDNLEEMDRLRKLTVRPPDFPADILILPKRTQPL